MFGSWLTGEAVNAPRNSKCKNGLFKVKGILQIAAIAAAKLCHECLQCKAWMYEPVKQNVILYSSVGQQINPGTLFVAGLRKCNRRYSQSPTLQPSLPEALTSNTPTLVPTKVSTYPHSWDALPSCVHRDTYLIGHTVTNIVGDPNCGTGTGVLPASTIEMASMKCEYCGDCRAWMWSPRLEKVIMYSKVVEQIHRTGTWYFSAFKSNSCKLHVMHFAKLPPAEQAWALKDAMNVVSTTMQSSASRRVEDAASTGHAVMAAKVQNVVLHAKGTRPVLAATTKS
jgi:hypothetical protein